MQPAARTRAISSILAYCMLFGVGGGCVAIYGFDDFERTAPAPCKTNADCPKKSECGEYVCEGDICKVINAVETGTLTSGNRRGDCLRLICDGRVNVVAEIDALDILNDGDACTIDTCEQGIPTNKPAPAGTPCGTQPNVACNAAGACAGCSIASDCGENNACTEWACENTICVKKLKWVGTVVDNAVPGDCRAIVCNTLGDTEEAIVNSDAPSDGNECTTDACTLEGKEDHQPANIDTPCGTCGVCTSDGTCVAYDPTKFDCYDGTAIPKPKTCTSASDCLSNYCVDGFCCDTECTSTCMACSNDKTGVPSGICATVTEGTDPDAECNTPEADTCSQGQCRCENGKTDGNETGVDCGGGTCNGCTGKWNCGGDTTCDGVGSPTSCCGFDCLSCDDQTEECKGLAGQTCADGATPRKLKLGVIWQAGCPVGAACRTITCNCVK